MAETPEMVERPWSEIVAPIIDTCEVATAFGGELHLNTQAADALKKLLKTMADELDALASPEEGRKS